MANTNPGGIDLNTNPYFDDYDEDKKFVRVLYRPGLAVQARELTQMQTYQQDQIRRFANYFFKQGKIIDGCEQDLDLNMSYVKLQSTFNGSDVDVTDFEEQNVFGANTGIKAYCGLVSDISGTDPKTLFINYLSSGSIVLTTSTLPINVTPGNTITFSTGNTATIDNFIVDPISGTYKVYVSNANGLLTVTTANTIGNTGGLVTLTITAVDDKTANTRFDNSEIIFTANTTSRSYANAATTRATSYVVNEGLATEKTYNFGSKFSISDGYMYLADHFVKNSSQTIILDKYSNEPSYKVGIVPSKSFVDYIEDTSLVDNAQGTPNYLAPGADRLKINPVLTKVTLGTVTDESEFVTLAEVDEGIAKKKKDEQLESKLEEAIARRTFEESGDYTINDPRLNVREHLLQNSNGGRYTSADGGNTNLLLFEVDPFTAYVSGFRNSTIAKTEIEVTKGLDEEFVEQTKTQANYGYYVEVKELVGAWDFMEATLIDIYDSHQQAVTTSKYGLASPSGSQIGTARVRAIKYVSGTQGTSDARYYLYIYDITMNTGKTFAQAKSFYDSATPKRYADIVSGVASVSEAAFNSLIFPLSYQAIKTIRDDQGNVESGFRFRKKFSNLSFTSGLATVTTTDASETFVGTDVLNATQKNENYAVIVTNGGANVETTTLTGTVTIGAGTNILDGSGTAFTTELNVGDIINANTETGKIASITNTTYATLESNHTLGASGDTYTKILPTGTLIPLSAFGGTGSARTVTVSSGATAVVFDVKEGATFTADIVTTMDRTNAREKKKTLNYQQTVTINANTHPNSLGGPFSLGYADVYQIHGIYQGDLFFDPSLSTSNTDVTNSYTFNNGQTETAYNHAYITPKSGVVPTGDLLVVFDYFSHDTTQGVGYCSVDSYPVNDTTTSNTTITTSNIPTFTNSAGRVFNLRDCVDFRPVKTANTTSTNPIEGTTYIVPNGGLHIPTPGSDFDADLIYYQGRIAKIYLSSRGLFGVNNGVPKSSGNRQASPPPKLPDTLELAEIVIPPYPSAPTDVVIRPLKNKRFTMKDVANINTRLERLEYYTALGFLEKQATDKVELDDVGLDRFKNGILTDPFTGHGVADVLNSDYKAAISRSGKFVTAYQENTKTADLVYDSSTSETLRTTGNKIMLPYTEAIFAEQPYASRQLNLAEELTFTWIGDMDVVPATDNFVETTRDPTQDIVYDDSGISDNFKKISNAWNTEVAPLALNWVGTPVQEVIGPTTEDRVGNEIVTSGFVQTSQEAYLQLSKVTTSQSTQQNADRVTNNAFVQKMRPRDFIIQCSGLKNNSTMYAFFDGVDVTDQCVQVELASGKTIQDLFDLLDADNRCMTLSGSTATSYDTGVYTVSDSAGTLRVKNNKILLIYRVPSQTFDAGQREFKLTDSPTNSDGTTTTFAKKSIFSIGISQTKSQTIINSRPTDILFDDVTARESIGRQVRSLQFQEITRVASPPPARRDPVAQSFYVDEAQYRNGCYLTSIDLYFRTKSSDTNLGATVEIREMFNGFPTRNVIGGEIARLENSAITVSEDSSEASTATFRNPIFLQPGAEYCFTIKPDGNSTDFTIWAAELGGIDITNPDLELRIDKQPASGVVFTSSNDYTWSERQNLDIKFKMNIASFTSGKVAYWNNVDINTAFTYAGFTPMIEEIILSQTGIQYEVQLADATYTVGDFFAIKNYERRLLLNSKQVSTSSVENTNGFKSATLKATLSTSDPYITPYIDDERITLAFEKNVISNDIETTVDGTIQFTSGTNYVFGTGTDFANDVSAGEYANFGDEYRRITSVGNTIYLEVQNNFTTSNTVDQQLIIRGEENPSGPYTTESRYITRVVTLNDGFEASDIVAYMNVNRPAGSSIKVYAKVLNENDTDVFADKFWQEMTLVGTETFNQNPSVYKEEKFILPSGVKTGGSQLLSGSVLISTANSIVEGTDTRFLEDLKIGDTVAVGTSRVERVVSTIANNTFLTVESAFTSTASGQEIYKVLNDTISYTTPDGRTFDGFKYFAIKIVFLSSSEAYSAKVKDLRVMALA